MENTPQQTTPAPAEHSRNLQRLRRILLVMIGIVTIIAAFYAEENWRGKRAWQTAKHHLEAHGEILDWKAFNPQRVPDEQNFFAAPKMTAWLTGRGSTELTHLVPYPTNYFTCAVADLKIIPPSATPSASTNILVVDSHDPEIQSKTHEWLTNTLGPATVGLVTYNLILHRPDPTNLPIIVVQTDAFLSTNQIEKLFTPKFARFRPRTPPADGGPDFRLQRVGTNHYRIFVNGDVFKASDYVAWFNRIDTNIEPLRTALERPYARMEGNYEDPIYVPIPNFVNCRMLAQDFGERAQCYFLLNQPNKALEQLTFIHNLCHILEGRPGKPITLVASMIDAAIQGLYAQVVGEGLHRHIWTEKELVVLQQQLSEVSLPPLVKYSLQSGRAGHTWILENYSRRDLARTFSDTMKSGLIERWRNGLYIYLKLGPSGWIDQNLAVAATVMQPVMDAIDLDHSIICPHQVGASHTALGNTLSRPSPYTALARILTPNYVRALETCAKDQTWVHLAYLACALERYHLVHNEYPETLNQLVPQFADHISHDIINGQPLHYHRTADGEFKLYSVGWNEKDDNGTPGGNETGDWIWQYPLP